MIRNLIRKLFRPRPRKPFIYAVSLPRIETQDAAKAFVRLFATEDGKKVLSWLQITTFQRALGPESSDANIRYLEGQRALMSTILRMIERGKTGS